MEGHVTLVAHELLVGVLLAPAQVTGAHPAGLVLVVLAMLARGPALPWTGEAGAQLRRGRDGESPPHTRRGSHGKTGSGLTSHWVFDNGAPLTRKLDLEHLVHEDDPTVIERTTPVRQKPLEHSSWPSQGASAGRTLPPPTLLRAEKRLWFYLVLSRPLAFTELLPLLVQVLLNQRQGKDNA